VGRGRWRAGLREQVAFEPVLGGRVSRVPSWWRSFLSRWNSKCKGPGAEKETFRVESEKAKRRG